MASRNLLAIDKLQEFKDWLVRQGFSIKPCKGQYEVLRWKGPKGRPLPIVFRQAASKVHLTCNHEAAQYVREWLRTKK